MVKAAKGGAWNGGSGGSGRLLLGLLSGFVLLLQAAGQPSGDRGFDPAECGCSDVPPPGAWSCSEQRDLGKCQAIWMRNPPSEINIPEGYCQSTCGLCDCPGAPVFEESGPQPIEGPCECADIPPPDSPWSCKQQRDFGKCFAVWMRNVDGLDGGYCQATCGMCPCTQPGPTSAAGNQSPSPDKAVALTPVVEIVDTAEAAEDDLVVGPASTPEIAGAAGTAGDDIEGLIADMAQIEADAPSSESRAAEPPAAAAPTDGENAEKQGSGIEVTETPAEEIAPAPEVTKPKGKKKKNGKAREVDADAVSGPTPEAAPAADSDAAPQSPEPAPDPAPEADDIVGMERKSHSRGENVSAISPIVGDPTPAPNTAPVPSPAEDSVPEPAPEEDQNGKSGKKKKGKKGEDESAGVLDEDTADPAPSPKDAPTPAPTVASVPSLLPESATAPAPTEEQEGKGKKKRQKKDDESVGRQRAEDNGTTALAPVPVPVLAPGPAPSSDDVPSPAPAGGAVPTPVPAIAPTPALVPASAPTPTEAQAAPTSAPTPTEGGRVMEVTAPAPVPAAASTPAETPAVPVPVPTPAVDGADLQEKAPAPVPALAPTPAEIQPVPTPAPTPAKGSVDLEENAPVPAPPSVNEELEDLSVQIENINDYEDELPPSPGSTSRKLQSTEGVAGSGDERGGGDVMLGRGLLQGAWAQLGSQERPRTPDESTGTSWAQLSSALAGEGTAASDEPEAVASPNESTTSPWSVLSTAASTVVTAASGPPELAAPPPPSPPSPPVDSTSCGDTMEALLNSPIGQSKFRIINQLLTKSGLLQDLKSPTLSATLFVPVDEAFNNLPKGITLDAILNDNSTEMINFIRKVVLYNMVSGVFYVDDFEEDLVLRTFYGKTVASGPDDVSNTLTMHYEKKHDAWTVKSAGGRYSAKIDLQNVKLCWSVIHVVNHILWPPDGAFRFLPQGGEGAECETIVGLLEGPTSGGQLGTLSTLIERAGLMNELRNPEFAATIFAPTDEAIANMPEPYCIEKLMNDNSSRAINEIQKLLLVHVVPKRLALSDLEVGTKVSTFASAALGLGEGVADIEIIKRGKKTKIRSAETVAKVVTPDIDVCGSVVHFIDHVFIPTFSNNIIELLTCTPEDRQQRAPEIEDAGGEFSPPDTREDSTAESEVRPPPEEEAWVQAAAGDTEPSPSGAPETQDDIPPSQPPADDSSQGASLVNFDVVG